MSWGNSVERCSGKSIRNEDELQFLILSLWKLDEREYQYAAVDIGKRFNKLFTPKSIPFIKRCVTIKSWWDTVDAIAIHFCGTIIYQYPILAKEIERIKKIDNKKCILWFDGTQFCVFK